MDKNDYFRSQNEDVAVIIHIEGTEGIECLDDIIAIDDIDIIFIGPYDLSQSLGIPGQVKDPRLLSKRLRVSLPNARRRTSMWESMWTMFPTAKRYKDIGVKYIGISVDVNIFAKSCVDLANKLNAL